MDLFTGPLVTVVVPVYNGEKFLRDALESVFDQDYRPLEVIVVDDGSEDGSGVIARSFPSARYVRQRNAGPAAARNTGITISNGMFVAFLDSDDIMLTHKVSSQVRVLIERPEVGCVLARQDLFIQPGTPLPAMPRDGIFGDPGGVQPQSAVVRRSVLEQVGGFDPSYTTAEGIEWLSRMRAAGVVIAVLDRVVTRKRIHPACHDYADVHASLLRCLRTRIRQGREPSTREEAPWWRTAPV